jgi:hypothetical protein
MLAKLLGLSAFVARFLLVSGLQMDWGDVDQGVCSMRAVPRL